MADQDITYTGTDTFENYVGTTGSASYTVRIDRETPTCSVSYNPSTSTNGNVTATLTGCSEAIFGPTAHTFT